MSTPPMTPRLRSTALPRDWLMLGWTTSNAAMAAKMGRSPGSSSCARSQARTVATDVFTACSSGIRLEVRRVAVSLTRQGYRRPVSRVNGSSAASVRRAGERAPASPWRTSRQRVRGSIEDAHEPPAGFPVVGAYVENMRLAVVGRGLEPPAGYRERRMPDPVAVRGQRAPPLAGADQRRRSIGHTVAARPPDQALRLPGLARPDHDWFVHRGHGSPPRLVSLEHMFDMRL